MSETSQHICRHCGLRFGWKPVLLEQPDSEPLVFCCRGCLGAWQLIQGAGLAAFYDKVGVEAPSLHGQDTSSFSDAELAPFVVPEGELCRLDLLVNGITCPACVWLLERIIQSLPGVSGVSLTYAARTASIRFDPHQCAPSAICSTIAGLGYRPRPYTPGAAEQEALREKNDLLLRLGTALFLTMQLMAYSIALYAGYFQGIDPALRMVLQYISAVVTAPVVLYCGWPFLRGAWQGIRSRMPGMDLLIAVGALSAFSYSCVAMLSGSETYFESAAMIVTFVLLGRLLELAVRRKAVAGLEGLLAAVPRSATRLTDNGPEEVAAEQLQPGDCMLVRQGERVPLDAVILEGESELDESAMTGESAPVLRRAGEAVRGGSLNLVAPLVLRAERPVATSFVMRVAGLVREAQGRKPAVQRLADRVAAVFVPSVLLLALLVGVGAYLIMQQPFSQAFGVALCVVLIACPCALGLAVPSAVLASCSRAASHGILFKGGDLIERLTTITRAAFDKTGTLTVGRPLVSDAMICAGFDRLQAFRAVASLEQGDLHPLARALAAYAREVVGDQELASEISVLPGRGMLGRLSDGGRVVCGNRRLMQEQGVAVPLEAEVCDGQAATPVYLALDGRLAARLLVRDQVRSGAPEVVAGLRHAGIESTLLSGDHPVAVQAVAADIGVAEALAELSPEQKAAWVEERQREGTRVLMVGDGVNDAPALALAAVSCVPAGSSDLALEHADLILADGDIALLPQAVALAIDTMRIIRQNLLWAFVYNMIGIPLAIAGLLTPVYAAAAMTASSLMVSLNSLRLIRGASRG